MWRDFHKHHLDSVGIILFSMSFIPASATLTSSLALTKCSLYNFKAFLKTSTLRNSFAAFAVFQASSADSTIFAVLDSHLLHIARCSPLAIISDCVHSLMLDDMSIIIFWWVGASLNDVGFWRRTSTNSYLW